MPNRLYKTDTWALVKALRVIPRKLRWPMYFLIALSLTAGIVASDQPWFVSYKGYYWFPAFSSLVSPTHTEVITDDQTGNKETIQFDIAAWKEMPTDFLVPAPIPWSPNKPDKLNRDYCAPFSAQFAKDIDGKIRPATFFERHHLGTDQLGNDLLTGIIHGIAASVKIGFFAGLFAFAIGVAWFRIASALAWLVVWLRTCMSFLPLRLLHWAQHGCRLSRSWPPPFMIATMWSTVSAGLPQ
jgi:ABC-type microcin C transport system permease subunit YejE